MRYIYVILTVLILSSACNAQSSPNVPQSATLPASPNTPPVVQPQPQYSVLTNWLLVGANILLAIATVGLAFATIYLAYATNKLEKTAEMQFLGSMAVAFQNEWHDKEQWSMRNHLYSGEFENVFNNAIAQIYKGSITYLNIEELKDSGNFKKDIKIKKDREELRDAFKKSLNNLSIHTLVKGQAFTPHEALNRVMLSMDRLVFLKKYEFFYDDFISKYIYTLAKTRKYLEPYIIIEQHLRPEPGFKKDLLDLLSLLGKQ